jgi:dimethylglycine dehydrogenase
VTRFGPTPKLKRLHVRSLELLTALEKEHGIGLHLSGSLRLIEKGNLNRLLEAEHHISMARLYDSAAHPTTMVSVGEMKALHPLLATESLECGVWTPHDGDVDPTQLTTVIARLAKEAGARFMLHTEAIKLTEPSAATGGQWEVVIKGKEGGEEALRADMVVNAAGLWSRGVSSMAGLHHPAFTIEHQYIVTEPLEYIKDLGPQGKRLPVLRDLAGSSYIRQEGQGMLIGPYEGECVVKSTGSELKHQGLLMEWTETPPRDWGMELFRPDLDRIADNLGHAMEVVPALQEAGIKTVVNGPTIWACDGAGRVGASRLPGLYDFNTQSYGIAQSLPLSEYLCSLMLDGSPPFDLSSDMDPLRYGEWADDEYCKVNTS